LREIKSFEDLETYKLARAFRKRIYELMRKLPKDEQYNLNSQMRRAAVSLTNNIAEGIREIPLSGEYPVLPTITRFSL